MRASMKTDRAGPGLTTGVVVGLLLTAPLLALSYLGSRVAALPFIPFDVFEWVAHRLPGAVVTRGIEALVAVIAATNLGSTDVAAKYLEQLMAIAGLLAAGAIAAGVVFVARRRRGVSAGRGGILLGMVAGMLTVLVSRSAGADRVLSSGHTLWILALWAGWGAALDWANRRLSPAAASPRAPIEPAIPPQERAGSEISGPGVRAIEGPQPAPGEGPRPAPGEGPRPAPGEGPRPAPDTVERLDRRRFLIRLGGAAAAITVSGAAVGMFAGPRPDRPVSTTRRWSADHALPNAGAALQPAPGTRPEFTPLDEHYRIDINLLPPVINEETWALEVRGLVHSPTRLTLADLRNNFRPMHQFVTLACISNEIGGDLIGTTRWTGVSMRRLLPHLRLLPEATHLKIVSADRFYEVVSLETINADERVMLTYAWDGVPLPTRHGFPLRIYIPNLYGMKQPKWITSIIALDSWEAGYWVVRGWDREARMEATAVIDTVALDSVTRTADGRTLVPVGGIAHAGDRSISKVEVRVDDGEWVEAQLRTPLSQTTWVLWRYEWPFAEGSHRFTVRCTDGEGRPQVTEPSPPHPDGATGLHNLRAGR